MNEEDYQKHLDECYIYTVISINSCGNDIKANVEFMNRDLGVALAVFNKLSENSEGTKEYFLDRGLL